MSFFANRSSRHAARLGSALTAHPARHIGFSRNRRRGEWTMRAGNPFKLALCLALAIPFALGACSGGGELTIPEIPEIPVKVSIEGVEQPTEQPSEQPSGGLRELPKQPGGTGQPEQPRETPQPASGPAKFFPLKADHLARINLHIVSPHGWQQDHPLDGSTTLDTLVPSTVRHASLTPEVPPTSTYMPQFSAFDFGESNTLNGIPVQEATTKANRYAAYAYQAILEHSAHIFQTVMHHLEADETASYYG